MNADQDEQESGLATIPKSRFFVWLFLSTEVMFFAALIGSYVVLRFGVPRSEWPPQSAVGLVPWVGGLNTAILILSSVFMTRSIGLANSDRSAAAKACIVVGLVLGALFLLIKSGEYWEKYRLGLFPRPTAPLVYPRYDVAYLSAVREEIVRARAQLGPSSATGDSRIELFDRLQLGLIAWASREYAQAASEKRRERAIQHVAHMIRPTPTTSPQIEAELKEQVAKLSNERDVSDAAKRECQAELDQSLRQLGELQNVEGADERKSELARRIAQRRDELTVLNNSRSLIDDRLGILELRSDAAVGLNASYGLRLPIVVPGGRTWLYGYYLLTGVHAFHLLAGIAVGIGLLWLTLNRSRVVLVGNVVAYWNFVDSVWLVLFPIIYLL